MKCPVCGSDCIRSAKEILVSFPTLFNPCSRCTFRVLDKRAPLQVLDFRESCSCGKRFIDDVFAHMYVIMVQEGDLLPTAPLIAVGSPLVHPGYAMERPPFLPRKSLTLLSSAATKKTSERLVEEVPELRGVIRKGDFVPGISDPEISSAPKMYELLAGCDVRADIFPIRTGPLVMYKQQSRVHIEFPRAGYPKLRAVEQHVKTPAVPRFIDACSGVGTLGLTAACLGVPHVILNDAWYASAFWSAFNLEVNREYLQIRKVCIFEQEEDMQKHPVVRDPVKIAETEGDQTIDVYQGDLRRLHTVIAAGSPTVTALDLFEKHDTPGLRQIIDEWKNTIGGEVFLP